MSESAVIFGCSGPNVTPGEAAFFRDANPWAFILFGRNVETPDQVRRLCSELRESVGRDALIFIDQEGGRVQRMGPPHWRKAPAANVFERMYNANPVAATRACYLNFHLIAKDLRSCGITADCAPVLDLPVPGADPIVSDRAFSTDRHAMVRLADACMAGLSAGGVAPVIKHIPGHGRATVDSHKALPVIDTPIREMQSTDFFPFKAMAQAPMAMTAHVVLSELDKTRPITTSKPAFQAVIRDMLDYDGLVMSDDLDMRALSGTLTSRTKEALAAGCDVVLQCSGAMPAMVKVAKGLKPLAGDALRRARIAEFMSNEFEDIDAQELVFEYNSLMSAGL